MAGRQAKANDFKQEQSRLYLLCYVCFATGSCLTTWSVPRQPEIRKVGRQLSLFVDETVDDVTSFGEVRRHAWKIMPRDTLLSTAQRMLEIGQPHGPALGGGGHTAKRLSH